MTDVLLIDSAQDRREGIATALAEQGISVTQLDSFDQRQLSGFDCVVGLDELIDSDLAGIAKEVPVVVTSERGSIPHAVASIHRGAKDYIELPTEPPKVVAAVERAAASAIPRSQSTLDQYPIVGSSSAIQTIKDQIKKVAPTDSTVLILGQSGTGKELVARALHAASDRAAAPFMFLNCATTPQKLIEAELFGLAQYDDAQHTSHGLVEAADGGTLFLDEVAELPPSAQARLLQVMQGENRLIGSSTMNQVDVRIIAATHRNLQQLTDDGEFRDDLFYRLKVVTLLLPLLREHKEDILEIADWLLDQTSRRLNKEGLTLSDTARQAMVAYHWPGNVRELENAIHRAVILSDNDSEITPTHLAIDPPTDGEGLELPTDGDQTSLEDYFVRFVTEHQDQMTETELAEKLGISRKSLWERRQRLNIPRTKTKRRGPRRDSS